MDANDLLMGGGVKSASFDHPGTEVGGTVVRPPVAKQATEYNPNNPGAGKPKFYDNGDPIMQVIVHVQTTLRDPFNPTDDGIRAIYIKGQMTAAVREAVRSVGGRGLEVGGQLYVRYESDKPTNGNPQKIYSARYVLPGAQAANAALMGGNNNGQPTYRDGPPRSIPPAPVTNGFAPPPTDTQQPPLGVDPAVWAVLSAEQRATVLAAATNR